MIGSIVQALGVVLIVAAVWLAFGVAAGFGAAGVGLLVAGIILEVEGVTGGTRELDEHPAGER